MPIELLFWTIAACALTVTAAAEPEPPRPPMTEGDPAPGKLVRQVAEEYRGTNVYHALYLPTNWRPGGTYPAIVEYAPNKFKELTGRVEDCRLGFHQSGGRDFLWVVMPYVDSVERENVLWWWGDEDTTAAYCVTTLRRPGPRRRPPQTKEALRLGRLLASPPPSLAGADGPQGSHRALPPASASPIAGSP